MKTRSQLFIIIIFSICATSVSAQTVHILKKNETLYSLAGKYDTSVNELIHLNKIEDPTKLYIGMEIIVDNPARQAHMVKRGETLYGIALKYGITLNELLKENSIDSDYLLKIGDLLKIPSTEEIVTEKTVAVKEPENGNKEQKEEETVKTDNPNKEIEVAINEKHWPIPGVAIPTDGKLSGVYIKGNENDDVRSISSGSVVWVGPYRGFGKVILIQSEDRYVYVYGGNASTYVTVGQEVTPGMVISILGVNPHTQNPELFFSVFRNGKPVDPENAPRL